MDALTVVANQYLLTVSQLSARIAQAALELTQAQEQIESLTKVNKAQEDVIAAYKKSAEAKDNVIDLIAGKDSA